MTSDFPLRHAVMKGGMYLFGRQLLSIGLKLGGVVLITRVLGPAGYGAYLSAFNIYGYVMLVGQAGVGVYLLRHEGDVAEQIYGTAYSLLLGMALILLTVLQVCTGWISAWIQIPGFDNPMRVIAVALPFQLLALPAIVRLERKLDYRSVAFIELAGQLAYYAIAIPLVMVGAGPVSLAIAWLAQQTITFAIAHIASKSIPRLRFSSDFALEMVRYTASFSLASCIWQLRALVNPLIVGPALGAYAVGIIGMTISVLELLTVIKSIAWRLSVAVLGKMQSDTERLRRAVTEGMEMLALAVGAIVLGFGWIGQILVVEVLGSRWMSVMDIYPYIALSYFTNAIFNMHTSTLSLLRRNGNITIFAVIHIALFAGTAALLVPRLGMLAYGLSEMVALISYSVILIFLSKAIGSPTYVPTLVWWSGAAVGLFWRDLGLWAIAVPFVVLAIPPSPTRILFYVRRIWAL
jgi:O-antigen/teichoic acid export membrane protein